MTIDLAKLKHNLDTVNKMIKEAIKAGDVDRVMKLKIDQEALKKEILISNRALNNYINT